MCLLQHNRQRRLQRSRIGAQRKGIVAGFGIDVQNAVVGDNIGMHRAVSARSGVGTKYPFRYGMGRFGPGGRRGRVRGNGGKLCALRRHIPSAGAALQAHNAKGHGAVVGVVICVARGGIQHFTGRKCSGKRRVADLHAVFRHRNAAVADQRYIVCPLDVDIKSLAHNLVGAVRHFDFEIVILRKIGVFGVKGRVIQRIRVGIGNARASA